VICHGEGIAVAPVAELELALEVGTPEIVGGGAGGERKGDVFRSGCSDVFFSRL
jgi:hypothetical protein